MGRSVLLCPTFRIRHTPPSRRKQQPHKESPSPREVKRSRLMRSSPRSSAAQPPPRVATALLRRPGTLLPAEGRAASAPLRIPKGGTFHPAAAPGARSPVHAPVRPGLRRGAEVWGVASRNNDFLGHAQKTASSARTKRRKRTALRTLRRGPPARRRPALAAPAALSSGRDGLSEACSSSRENTSATAPIWGRFFRTLPGSAVDGARPFARPFAKRDRAPQARSWVCGSCRRPASALR